MELILDSEMPPISPARIDLKRSLSVIFTWYVLAFDEVLRIGIFVVSSNVMILWSLSFRSLTPQLTSMAPISAVDNVTIGCLVDRKYLAVQHCCGRVASVSRQNP